MRALIAVCCVLIALGVAGCSSDGDLPTPTATATPAPPLFGVPPGQLAPFAAEVTLRSKRVEELPDGRVTFHARISDGIYTEDQSVTVEAPQVNGLRACWDSAEVGEPVPDCMLNAFSREPSRNGSGIRPLGLATPAAVPSS